MKMRLLIILLAILLIGAAGYGAWRLTHAADAASKLVMVPHVETGAGGEEPVPPGMARFVHPRYGFSLIFPDTMTVTRSPEGNASETDIFAPRDASSTSPERFQLFITPYAEATITAERLAEDIPNHDIRNMQEVVIGESQAIHAAIFQSSAPLTGEQTREVWFIHDGFIFEVTAPFAADSWLAGILASFRFVPVAQS